MENRGDEFSFHEMEQIKRGLTTAPASASPVAPAGGGNPAPAPQELPPEEGRDDLESLHLRRALRVMGNHWLIIGLLTLSLPIVMFLYDAGFNNAYLRGVVPQALRAKRQYTAELKVEIRQNSAPFGSELKLELPLDKNNLRKLVARDEFLEALRRRVFGADAKAGELPEISAAPEEDGETEILVQGGEPEAVGRAATETVAALNDYLRAVRQEYFDKALAEQQRLVDGNRQKLAKALLDFEAIDRSAGGVGTDRQDSPWVQVHNLDSERLKAELDLQRAMNELTICKARVRYDELAKSFGLGADSDIARVTVEGNPLRTEWAGLEAELAKLQARYTDEHPKIVSLRENINSLRDALKARGEVTSLGIVPPIPRPAEIDALCNVEKLDRQVEYARLNVATTGKMLDEARARASSADEAGATAGVDPKLLEARTRALSELEYLRGRDREATKAVIDLTMLRGFMNQDADYAQLGEASPARLTRPRTAIDVVVALIVGLVLGIGLSFLLESMDVYIHTPSDVYYHLRLNYLGVIPLWPEKGQELISPEHPDNHISEVYSHLCNNLRYGGSGNPEKRLLVASALQSEGKSTISANLAARYAIEGNNVVLIDADMRRPRGHKLLDIFQGGEKKGELRGLSEYLSGTARAEDIVYPTNIPGLSLAPAGQRARNAAKLLSGPGLPRLLDWAEGRFDTVIVDCPAVLPVVDATIIAPHVRGVLLVVAAEEVEIGAVKMALYRLRHVGAPVAGAVLNKVRERSTSYAYYGYRYRAGYYYSPYGSDEGEGEDKGGDAGAEAQG